ncbi:MAG: zincin-like metallopeptidase domain-containing protein [Bryobacteraceae bacterium]|jgi:antirestriction protein ArdC
MSTHENTATEKLDVYQRVTSAIVNAIESGIGEYRMPWTVRQDKGFSPISVGSAKAYRGINTLVLWAQSQSKGYSSALWGTYQQWQGLGGQVRKGEHGSPVVYWGTYEKQSSEDEDEKSHRGLFAKGYTVFNIEQVDGCKLPKRFEPKLSHNERIALAESFFARVGVQIRDGGNRAFYRPDTPEAVYMPGFTQFPDRVDYYSVLAHETTHWTSHASRCDRQLGKRFGDDAYAVEELIAELGSAYTMARLEVELTPRADHARYIGSWLKVLKADKRAIFTAASKAQQAADYLIARSARVAEVAA